MCEILEHGQWSGDVDSQHVFDKKLAKEIVNILKDHDIQSAVDLGCGDGHYVKFLRKHDIACIGFDGHPQAHKRSKGLAVTLDLALPINPFLKASAVLCLEVGEHIPKKFEDTLLDNITQVAQKLVLLSWAVPGQGGYGHVNCQTNEHITRQMALRGFDRWESFEKAPREKCTYHWFTNTFMIFQKCEKL